MQSLTKTQRKRAAKKAKLKQQQAEQQPAVQSAHGGLAAAAIEAEKAKQQPEQQGRTGGLAANEQTATGLAAAAAEACREAGGLGTQE